MGSPTIKGCSKETSRYSKKAYEELEAIKPELSGDKDALAALGILSEEGGDYNRLRSCLKKFLNSIPAN